MPRTKTPDRIDIHLRMTPDFVRDIDEYRFSQACIPSTPAAIRQLARERLAQIRAAGDSPAAG